MKMTGSSMPLELPYNLGRLGAAGDEIVVTARKDQLAQLAHWTGVRSIELFVGTVSLHRISSSRFDYNALLNAEIVQECVVTLEPVRSVLNRKIHRELHLSDAARLPAARDIVVDPVSENDDVREEISTLHYDLAGPLLEELILAIDPYPRAPGVAFTEPLAPPDRPESPFAVLKNLKK